MNIIWNRTSRKGIENEDPKYVINGVVTYKYVVIEGQVTVFAAALGKKYITRELEKEMEERVLAEIDKESTDKEAANEVANDVDTKLLSKLPKKVQPLVEALYKDSEGYWIHLVPTHLFVSMDAHTEHALTLAELKSVCRQVNIKEV
nr:MAG TPA: hypothetical protein [Caudoviricetes sp.]